MDGVGRLLAWGILTPIAMYIGAIVYVSRSYARDQALICPAQKLEIAPGVTLMRGLQCFFGQGSRWKVSKGVVYVESGFPDETGEHRFVNGIELVLCVDPKAGRIEVVTCRLAGGYNAENLIDALIRAASGA